MRVFVALGGIVGLLMMALYFFSSRFDPTFFGVGLLMFAASVLIYAARRNA